MLIDGAMAELYSNPQVELAMFQFEKLLEEVDAPLHSHLETQRKKIASGIEPTCRLFVAALAPCAPTGAGLYVYVCHCV